MQFLIPNDFDGRNYHTLTGNFVDYSGALYNNGGDNLTIDEFMAHKGYKPEEWAILPEDVFMDLYQQKERERFLTGPQEITEDDYHEMLNVLPPENWTHSEGFEHFRMCEYTSGSITNQYAHRNGKYITKPIDVCDKSTWITLADFDC